MTSKEIVDAVTSYVRDENVKYAILIDGAWGSGKTFLYENDLCDAISDIEIGKMIEKQMFIFHYMEFLQSRHCQNNC